MKARAAKTAFLKRLGEAGHSLETLTPALGIEAMLAYYLEERVDGCLLDEDGDMLLFQWGTNNWGRGPAFEVSIVRQLIVADDEENEPRQLDLRFRFQPAAGASAGDGNRWCQSPEELSAFRRFVNRSAAVKTVVGQTPESVELRFQRT